MKLCQIDFCVCYCSFEPGVDTVGPQGCTRLFLFDFISVYSVILSSEAHLRTHILIPLNEPFKQFNFNQIKHLKGEHKNK